MALPPVESEQLDMPIGSLATWVEPVYAEDSFQLVARELAVQAVPVIPVVQGHSLIGVVSEEAVRGALLSGVAPHASVGSILNSEPPTLDSSLTGRVALDYFNKTSRTWVLVVDSRGEPVGVLTPSRLLRITGSREFKGRVGGMATPFGVYLTNGIVSGGASNWALVATGAIMATLFHVAGFAVLAMQNALPLSLQNSPAVATAAEFSWMILFFLGLRILPLSGTHGAEHMVVHAIERGEELEPEIVSRMPRVHPRCGTNLAVAAMLFLGIMSIHAIRDTELRLLLATLATLLLWQPLGSLMQLFVTTKPPNRKQLQDGIKAGRELLSKAGGARVARPTIFSRLAMSGLFQVLAGGMSVAIAVFLICEVLRVPPHWRVS